MQDEEDAQADDTDDKQVQLNCAFHFLKSRGRLSVHLECRRHILSPLFFANSGPGSPEWVLTPAEAVGAIALRQEVLICKRACGSGHPFFRRSDGRVGLPQSSPLWVIARTDRHRILIFVVVIARPLE